MVLHNNFSFLSFYSRHMSAENLLKIHPFQTFFLKGSQSPKKNDTVKPRFSNMFGQQGFVY